MVKRFVLIVLLAGCTPAPRIPGAPVSGAPSDAPALVPVQQILAQGGATSGRTAPDAGLAARAAALRARAARLRGR